MAPLGPVEWTYLVAALLFLTTCIWLIPSCGDPTCTATHAKHVGAKRIEAAEKEHATWHGTDRPSPTCVLCAARKRDE